MVCAFLRTLAPLFCKKAAFSEPNGHSGPFSPIIDGFNDDFNQIASSVSVSALISFKTGK